MKAMERQQRKQCEENKKRKIERNIKKICRIWQLLEFCFKGSDRNINKNKNWHSTVKYSV